MNVNEIKTFAAAHGLTITALHANGEATGRDLTDSDAGFAISCGQGRDSEDLGRIWVAPTDLPSVLERAGKADELGTVMDLLKALI